MNYLYYIYIFFAIISIITTWKLVEYLKYLINKQVEIQLDEFSKKARIPKKLKKFIGIKIVFK